jgi:hypothetical protein
VDDRIGGGGGGGGGGDMICSLHCACFPSFVQQLQNHIDVEQHVLDPKSDARPLISALKDEENKIYGWFGE